MHADHVYVEKHQDEAFDYWKGYYKIKRYWLEDGDYKGWKNPESILNRGVSDFTNQTVINYSFNHGDYGGAGAGFFGLQVENKNQWLIFTIAHTAMNNMLLDNKWIEVCDTTIKAFNPKEEPWVIYGYASKLVKNEFKPLIIGSVIVDVKLERTSCKILLEKDGKRHLLEILDTDKRLCPYPGIYYDKKRIEYPPALRPDDHIGNYIIFMEEKGEIYV